MARSIFLFVFIFLFLSPLLLTAQPAQKTFAEVESAEKESAIMAKQWATTNSYPVLQYMADETLIGVQGFQEGLPVFFTTHNQQAGIHTRTTNLHPGGASGYNLTGLNLTIGLWDASPAYSGHQEHQTRIVQKETGGPSNHATHVAGTLAASGINAEALGMAPQARVHTYNWNFHSTEMLVEARDGLLISNHSYGRIAGWHKFNLTADSTRWQWFGDPSVSMTEDYVFGYYDQDASLFDHVTYTYPFFLPVVSAGNERDDQGPQSGPYLALDKDNRWLEYDVADRSISPDGSPGGFDTLTGIATAKNVLTIGSVVQTDAGKAPAISGFSSAGPTDDGRIKPDLVGIGENLFSTIATGSSDYASYSGTSMATPNVAGSLILVQQLAKQLLGQPLRASSVKGLAIHTATDLETPGPDYSTGWGLLNTEKAVDHIQDTFRNPFRIQEEKITDSTTFQLELSAQNNQDIRITLCWTDPAFTPIKAPAQELLDNPRATLVHDLNLRLINQSSGDEFFPYILSSASPELPATTGINSIDPVEQIYIPDAEPGLYTLIVEPGNGFISEYQDFSLLISGLQEPVAPVVLDTAQIYAEIGNVELNWQTVAENTPGVFIVERANASILNRDGTANTYYEEIAVLDSRGNSEESSTYQYHDNIFLQGDYHYRVLFHQHESEDKILLAEFEVNIPAPPTFAIASVYPNPVHTQGTLILDVPERRFIQIAIYNVLGQQVLFIPEKTYDAGRHLIEINPGTWSRGTYFVQINAGGQKVTHSFVVMK